MPRLPRPGLYAAQTGLLAAAYWAAAQLSLLVAIPPGYAAAIWPASGIALAALLIIAPGHGPASGWARSPPTSASRLRFRSRC
jgi:hypothetical protein